MLVHRMAGARLPRAPPEADVLVAEPHAWLLREGWRKEEIHLGLRFAGGKGGEADWSAWPRQGQTVRRAAQIACALATHTTPPVDGEPAGV